MASELFNKAADYVKKQMSAEPTGHDWFHVERVLKTARKLQAIEGGDLELIELGAVLHDLGDYKNYEYDEEKARLVLRGMMGVLEMPVDLQEKIEKIVEEIQYRGIDTKAPTSLEAKIIQDADWLDAVGAISIARTFATGGRIKRVLHDPRRKPRNRLKADDYLHRKQEGTSFNYFYEKALKLPEIINTKTAQRWAVSRIEFLKKYIEQFLAEWEGKDFS
jgi:uncharacterized protein